MNDHNKHKPLSTEELFKLLEAKNENSLPDNELDDFEKDALEGFSQYSSLEKAKALTEEIHVAINNKVSEKKTKPVAKIVWFSAAASVILLVMLSVYFLTQSTKEEPTSLALNKEIPEKKQAEPSLPAEETEGILNTENKPADVVSTITKPAPVTVAENDKQPPAQGPVVLKELERETTVSTKLAKDGEYKALDDLSKEKGNVGSVDAKITSGTFSQEVAYTSAPSISNGTTISNNTTIKAYDVAGKQEIQQNVSLETSAKEQNAVTVTKNRKAKQKEAKKASEEISAASGKADSDKGDALPSLKASDAKVEGRGAAANIGAYYNGGEEAIKKYIVSHLKQENYTEQSLKGTYKITIRVMTDGKIAVETITEGKNGDQNMAEPVRKILNGMSGWNPAVLNGYIADSNVTLELTF
ncbi:MAG: hypothetical protein V4506_00245 [Bacteroidota bacterium]